MWKFVRYATGIFLFILLVVGGFTQTKFFRERLRAYLLSELHAATQAEFQFGSFAGNLLTYVSITDLHVRVEGEDLFRARRLVIHYSPFQLLRNRLFIRSLVVEVPELSLRRMKDGRWNSDALFPERETPDETSPNSSRPWSLEVRRIDIRGGDLLVLDSLKAEELALRNGTLLVNYFAITDLNAEISGSLSGGTARADIRKLDFRLPQTGMKVRRMSGQVEVGDTSASVAELAVETERSRFTLSARIDHVDMKDLTVSSLESSPTMVDLKAESIDFKELRSFIPSLTFLQGSVTSRLIAKGNFERMAVDTFAVSTAHSLIQIEGTVSNLHKPEKLLLSLTSYDDVIDLPELNRLIPGLSLPELGHLGRVRLDISFDGKPLAFNSKFVIRSAAGDVEGDLQFDFLKSVAEYRGTFKTRDLDIGRIVQDENLEGRISVRGTVDGGGFDLRSLNTTCRVEVDTSEIFGMPIESGVLAVETGGGLLNLIAVLSSHKVRLDADGRIDFTIADSIAYRFEASFTSLDLAKILRDSKYSSNLSFLVRGEGWGESIDDFSGTFSLALSPSMYRDKKISQTKASLDLNQANPLHKVISIRSDVLDADIEGQFDATALLNVIKADSRQFLRVLQRKLAPLDSVFAHSQATVGSVMPSEAGPLERNVDASPRHYDVRFRTNIKDLEPIAVFLGEESFDGHADLSGTITGPSDGLSVSLGGFINEFFYGSVREGVFVGKMNLQARFEGLSPSMEVRDLRSAITLDGNSLFVNRTEFSDFAIDFNLEDERSMVGAHAVLDSLFFFKIHGQAAISNQPYRLVLDTVRLGSGEYAWQAENPLIVDLDKRLLSVEEVAFVRGSERIRLDGALHQDGRLELDADFPTVDLGSFLSVIQKEEIARRNTLQGAVHLVLTVRGRFEAPIVALQLAVDDINYRGVPLGTMRSSVLYRDQVAALDVEFRTDTVRAHSPELSVNGTLPVDLRLSRTSGAVEGRFPNAPMDLKMAAQNFQLTFLDPILASFEGIQGTVSGDVQIKGTPQSPLYTGQITTQETRFLFVPNGLRYTVDATLQAERDNVRIVSMQIKNDAKDRPDGIMSVSGTIALKEFSISSFDLSAQGRLLILTEGPRKKSQELQGNLFASTGPEGLHYAGTFEQSHLTGTVQIERASLLFPALQQNTYASSAIALNYVVVDDTSFAGSDTSSLAQYQRLGNQSVDNSNGQTRDSRRTILDGISYDVNIETRGNVEIRMVFNAVTGEELYAVLNGKLSLVRNGPNTQLIGQVAVVEPSYYTFYKKFGATGKLRFTGDPDNPELEISAQYKGVYFGPTKDKPDTTLSLNALVDLTITGTRYEPKLKIDLVVTDQDGSTVTPLNLSDPQADAISYILVGKFKNDLTSADRNSVYSQVGSSIRTSLVTGFASTLLSEVLTDFFRNELGFVRTVELTYYGTGSLAESADLRLSGEIFSAYWRFGGRIFTDPSNANVSVQLSMGDVFNSSSLRNLMLELERRVRDIQYTAQDKDTYGARLYYRITF